MVTIVEEVLKEKEEFLRRHLILSEAVVEKLHKKNVIGELTMKHMLVCTGKHTFLFRSKLNSDLQLLITNLSQSLSVKRVLIRKKKMFYFTQQIFKHEIHCEKLNPSHPHFAHCSKRY